jgi:hypothetical protein
MRKHHFRRQTLKHRQLQIPKQKQKTPLKVLRIRSPRKTAHLQRLRQKQAQRRPRRWQKRPQKAMQLLRFREWSAGAKAARALMS